MTYLTAALVALLALLATHTWFGPDIWYHLAWGRALLEQGRFTPDVPALMRAAPVGNPYWLYQLVISQLFAVGGVGLVTAAHVALWAGIGVAWARLARASEAAFGPVAMLAFVALAQMRLEYRPETVSYLLLALMLIGVGPARWPWWALAGLEVIWVNAHGYFALGPALAWGAALTRRDRASLVAALAVSLATFVNPAGPFVFADVWSLGRVLGQVGAGIEELTPMTSYAWWAWPMPLFWALVGVATAGIVIHARTHRLAALFAAVGLVLGVRSIRFLPLMLIMTGPLLGETLRRGRWPRAGQAVALVASVFAAGFIVSGRFHLWRGSGTTFGVGLDWAEYPIGATEFLRARDFAGRLFNEPGDGGYLEYNLPRVRIASDSSYVDVATTREYFAAAADPRAFADADRRFDFDAALIAVTNERIVDALLRANQWVTAYADSHRILFVRRARFGTWAQPLAAFAHRHGEDLRRPEYQAAAAAWFALAEREKDASLKARLNEEF